MSAELIVNFSEPREKQLILAKLRGLAGPWRVELTRHRPRRSDRQNRFYWPCFCQPLAEFLRDQGQPITDEYAHEILKHKFLRRTAVNPATGEVVGEYTRSTTELTTAEFNEYLDACAEWLASMFGITVPEPNVYRLRGVIVPDPADYAGKQRSTV